MNRRTFLLRGAIACGAIPWATAARAARLPTSTVTVNVLSVVRESVSTEAPRSSSAPVVFETSHFVAKARIVSVQHNEHQLEAGAIIDIRYRSSVRTPPDPNFARANTRQLVEGATVTLTIFGGGTSFTWRG